MNGRYRPFLRIFCEIWNILREFFSLAEGIAQKHSPFCIPAFCLLHSQIFPPPFCTAMTPVRATSRMEKGRIMDWK